MMPIHELLARIRWDAEFARGDFVLGYYDRVEGKVVQVPLAQVQFEPGEHFSFVVSDPDGYAHEVPFHRVREVRKDGRLIWQRGH